MTAREPREQDLAWLQDVLCKLVLHAEVGCSQLLAAALHQLLLLFVLFEYDQSGSACSGWLSSKVMMTSVEGDAVHGVLRKLQVSLDKLFHCSFRFLLSLLWDAPELISSFVNFF